MGLAFGLPRMRLGRARGSRSQIDLDGSLGVSREGVDRRNIISIQQI